MTDSPRSLPIADHEGGSVTHEYLERGPEAWTLRLTRAHERASGTAGA